MLFFGFKAILIAMLSQARSVLRRIGLPVFSGREAEENACAAKASSVKPVEDKTSIGFSYPPAPSRFTINPRHDATAPQVPKRLGKAHAVEIVCAELSEKKLPRGRHGLAEKAGVELVNQFSDRLLVSNRLHWLYSGAAQLRAPKGLFGDRHTPLCLGESQGVFSA
ncbi:MAG: hypothetical protein KGL39_33680 [Patescibacteria group bacterium]|nr:hypothetical protein [Patescibacteria group bacterium]